MAAWQESWGRGGPPGADRNPSIHPSVHPRSRAAVEPCSLGAFTPVRLIGANICVAQTRIEGELVDICGDILDIITSELVPNSSGEDAKVFYYKMKGDYHRYLAEIQSGETRKNSSASALEAYEVRFAVSRRGKDGRRVIPLPLRRSQTRDTLASHVHAPA